MYIYIYIYIYMYTYLFRAFLRGGGIPDLGGRHQSSGPYRCLRRRNTPPEKNTHWNVSFQSTKSWAAGGLQGEGLRESKVFSQTPVI